MEQWLARFWKGGLTCEEPRAGPGLVMERRLRPMMPELPQWATIGLPGLIAAIPFRDAAGVAEIPADL